MIEAKTVTFAYRRGIPVLNDISCTIHDGRRWPFWGIMEAAKQP